MKKPTIIILIILFLAFGCQKIGEYYAGMNMQPDLSKEDFTPGLNVYGVLKTGDNLDSLNQYFEVNQVLFINESFDSIAIKNADIVLTRIPLKGTETVYRLNHFNDGVYLNRDIETAPGDQWLYKCNYDTFEVASRCIIPYLPVLKGTVVITPEKSIRFSVQSDSSAFMYDIYLLNGENFFFEKRVPLKGIDSDFDLKPEWDTTLGKNVLFIFAYDENLEKYYTTSNTFFKPNAFRTSFSTVNGGYGTFGAISSIMVIVS